MNAKTYFKLLAVSFLLGIGISLTSCGSSSGSGSAPLSSGVPVPQTGVVGGVVGSGTTCTQGYTSIDGVHCVQAGLSFHDACLASGGAYLSNLNGAEACQVLVYSGSPSFVSSAQSFPTLTPSTPQNPTAFSYAQPNVLAGDKLTIVGASGGWGSITTQQSTFLGVFSWVSSQSQCSEVSIAGVDQNSKSTVYNESEPSGLMVSDGSDLYPVSSGAVITLQGSGTLRFGFNASPQISYSSIPCGWGSVSYYVERCVNSAGQSLSCP